MAPNASWTSAYIHPSTMSPPLAVTVHRPKPAPPIPRAPVAQPFNDQFSAGAWARVRGVTQPAYLVAKGGDRWALLVEEEVVGANGLRTWWAPSPAKIDRPTKLSRMSEIV